MNDIQTEAMWEKAAQTAEWRARIHPSGEVSDEAYEASGMETFECVRQLVHPRRKQIVWDIGCGDGRVTVPLACWYHEVVGIDSSPTMLGRLAMRAPIQTFGSISEAVAVRARPDVCVCIAVLIHLTHERAYDLIGQMADALKPGGRLVMWLPLYEEPREPLSWIDLATWSLAELKEAARLVGLEIERALESPGAFEWGDGEDRYGHRGPHHEAFTVLRKRS